MLVIRMIHYMIVLTFLLLIPSCSNKITTFCIPYEEYTQTQTAEHVASSVSSEFSIIKFDDKDWLVFDYKDGKAFILSEKIIEHIASHNTFRDTYSPVTWTESDLHKYLNGEFFRTFIHDYMRQTLYATAIHNNNLWHNINGVNATTDNVFLLSSEEVVRYFGGSEQFENLSASRWYRFYPNTKRTNSLFNVKIRIGGGF